ncbi:MAG TPA: chorismate-binding protein [Thermoanaerobaculia bacterium]|nr:chorismate-binding protein [Thermoanaerobaculia bacterium]
MQTTDTSRPAIDPAMLDQLRREYDIIPIVRMLSGDTITPVAAFAALADPEDEACLLESVERGEAIGRYSFLGVRPRRKLGFRRGDADPAKVLRDELVPLRVWKEEGLPPLFGGAFGWFGYGVSRWTERLPDRHGAEGDLDAELLFFDHVVAFDHLTQKLYVCANLFASDPLSSEELLAVTAMRLDSMVQRLARARVDLAPLDHEEPLELEPRTSREEFIDAVRKAKEEIVAGEIFQIVLSQRWVAPFPTREALTLYRALRSVNPSPYMFLLRTSERVLVGASPEMLVRVQHGAIETRPIAGTRPRGATPAEDHALADELLADVKENAEHLMLVDLGRNDVGRVAAPASVEVPEFRRIERYSHVMHLVSSVIGRLREGKTPVDAFLSAFPAGTVSGAPKIRAMELIDQLEPLRRDVYAGAVMYAGFSGNLDSCIAIRTIVLAGDEALIQAGAGIVHDSVPEKEYEETVNKAAALAKAVRLAAGASHRLVSAASVTSFSRGSSPEGGG